MIIILILLQEMKLRPRSADRIYAIRQTLGIYSSK